MVDEPRWTVIAPLRPRFRDTDAMGHINNAVYMTYLEVARRVGVLAQGVNFPGHFLVRVAIEDAWLFLDPFSGGRTLTPADLEAVLARDRSADRAFERRVASIVDRVRRGGATRGSPPAGSPASARRWCWHATRTP